MLTQPLLQVNKKDDFGIYRYNGGYRLI